MNRKKYTGLHPRMWSNYASSDDAYFEFYKERMNQSIESSVSNMPEPPFRKAEILNGLFSQSTSGNVVEPEAAREIGDRRVFRIRFLDEADDSQPVYSRTSMYVNPGMIKNPAARAALTLSYPEAYPADPEAAEKMDFAPGDILDVYQRDGRYYYDTGGDKFDEKAFMRKIYMLYGSGVNPENAFANAGKSVDSLSQKPHPLNFSNTNKRERKIGDIEYIIIHYGAAATLMDTIDALGGRSPPLAYHYIIDYDGSVTTFHPEKQVAGHAGHANPKSIGVNFVNLGYARQLPSPAAKPGDDEGSAKAWLQHKGVTNSEALTFVGPYKVGRMATHKERGSAKMWPSYPQKQWQEGAKLVAQIMTRWEIDPKNIYTHSDFEPDKSDSGPAFPMDEFKKAVAAQYTGPRVSSD